MDALTHVVHGASRTNPAHRAQHASNVRRDRETYLFPWARAHGGDPDCRLHVLGGQWGIDHAERMIEAAITLAEPSSGQHQQGPPWQPLLGATALSGYA